MKIQLIAALFIAALVAVPCFAEEETPANDNAPTVNGALQDEDQPENPPVTNGGLTADTEEEPKQDESEEDDEDEPEEEDENVDDNSVPEEMQDEVENVKRARRLPQLSHRSCLILKRYGYCRHRGIAKFCFRQCRPRPICKDLISYASCRKVRYSYRRCRHLVGRVYCRKTCGFCRRPVRFRTRTPYWCGSVRNRIYWRSRVTLRQCQAECVRRGRGCRAIEWWGKYNFNCYICRVPRFVRYSNRKDLAWPPYVSVKY